MSYPLALATWPPLATVLSAGSVTLTSTVKLDCVLGTLVWLIVSDRLQPVVTVAVGVGVGIPQLSLPIVINVPGELWLLYSVVIQPWERTPAATWTSSIAPLYRLLPCWPDMSKSAVECIEPVKLSNCVVVAFAIPSS